MLGFDKWSAWRLYKRCSKFCRFRIYNSRVCGCVCYNIRLYIIYRGYCRCSFCRCLNDLDWVLKNAWYTYIYIYIYTCRFVLKQRLPLTSRFHRRLVSRDTRIMSSANFPPLFRWIRLKWHLAIKIVNFSPWMSADSTRTKQLPESCLFLLFFCTINFITLSDETNSVMTIRI